MQHPRSPRHSGLFAFSVWQHLARFGTSKQLFFTSLSHGLGQDMIILAEVFAHIAPTRKLLIAYADPELVTKILKRAAMPPADPVQSPGN
ncbi:hypothetical protein [Aquitalea sp. ASV15]|uniref:hypothetical protein n=1 Tax=Aquitalea sp. ASV15 TaxID=2795104 RepID=UPI0018EB9704|nr:hypothetical protein [Aquitalea sp. ASV15]